MKTQNDPTLHYSNFYSSSKRNIGTANLHTEQSSHQTIIHKKKSLASFERRFLSACGTGEQCILEVAMVWPDKNYVLAIHQYEFQPGMEISVGSRPECQYQINLPCEKFVIAHCNSNHQWTLNHSHEMNGFILNGEQMTEFAHSEFKTHIDKNIRAKYIFGEVSILVHFIDRTDFHATYPDIYHCAQKAVRGGLAIHNYTALIASLLIHFVGLSVGLFAPGHVSALMVDRFTTSSRFEVVVSPEIPTVTEEAPITEPVPGQAEDPENVFEQVMAIDRAKPQSSHSRTNSGFHKSQSELLANSPESIALTAKQQAGETGLLAQAKAMNALLAAITATSDIDPDWSQFDESFINNNTTVGIGYPPYVLRRMLEGNSSFHTGNTIAQNGLSKGITKAGSGMAVGPCSTSNNCSHVEAHIINVCGSSSDCERIGVKTRSGEEITGSLDKRIIQKVVRQHLGELKACYEREISKLTPKNESQLQKQLGKSEKPEGTLSLMWIIAGNGSVTDVKLTDSTLHNKTVESCVVNAIKYWRFPSTKDGGMTKVEYPFTFTVSN